MVAHSSFGQKFVDGHTDVPGNLTQQWRCDVPSTMIRNCGLTSVRMFKLAVGASLADQTEPVRMENGKHLPWFQYGNTPHLLIRLRAAFPHILLPW